MLIHVYIAFVGQHGNVSQKAQFMIQFVVTLAFGIAIFCFFMLHVFLVSSGYALDCCLVSPVVQLHNVGVH